MEKKLYVPKITKFIQREDGLKRENYYPQMSCKWCGNELTDKQKYEALRGKTSGNSCSASCSNKIRIYGTKESELQFKTKKCTICGCEFIYNNKHQKICSLSCVGKITSKRMKINNPMSNKENRIKASNSQKLAKHKPLIQGGNGRGATVFQLQLYNELTKIDNSFSMEYIEKTGKELSAKYKTPYHYKIDIASKIHKIAIEVDGSSHNSLKVKECDERKNTVLNLLGWKVLRLSNSQIKNELQNCVQMVLSMI